MKEQEFISGLIPDPKDERDILLGNYLLKVALPSEFSWDDDRVPILNQGKTPECVSHSAGTMKVFQELREHNKIYSFDCHELYRKCKEEDGMSNQSGTFIRICCKVLQQRGILYKQKEKELYFPISAYAREENLEELKFALVANGPFTVGVPVFSNWFTGSVIDILKDESILGYHAICLYGYSDSLEQIFFRNSWSEDWGIKGKASLTYRYIEKYLVSAWSTIDIQDKFTACFLNTEKIKNRICQIKE